MMGLPTETDEDLAGIANLGFTVLTIGDEVRHKKNNFPQPPQVGTEIRHRSTSLAAHIIAKKPRADKQRFFAGGVE